MKRNPVDAESAKKKAIRDAETDMARIKQVEKLVAKAINKALDGEFVIVSVIAVHKSLPKHPIIFYRGHLYDVARATTTMARQYKAAIDRDLDV
jgi:hypothetical protein